MIRSGLLSFVPLALAIVLSVDPALAQGSGRGQQGRPRVEQDRGDWQGYPTLGDYGRGVSRGNGAGKVPPGWCRGVGNPHRTVENCGYRADSRVSFPRGSGGGVYGGSYEDAHARFHRELDDRYNRLAAQRPLDIRYQLELQARKRAEHDAWHRRVGISH